MKHPAIIFIGIGLLMLIALFVLFRPHAAVEPRQPTTDAPVAPNESAAPAVHRFRVEQGRRAAGPEIIRIEQGALVELTVISDTEDELHLHGYDRRLHVPAGEPVTLAFEADHAGRFDAELHKADLLLTTIEVQPR